MRVVSQQPAEEGKTITVEFDAIVTIVQRQREVVFIASRQKAVANGNAAAAVMNDDEYEQDALAQLQRNLEG